jgi:hypothetical protein
VSVRISTPLTAPATRAVANPKRVRVDAARVETLTDAAAIAADAQPDLPDVDAATAA